MFMEHLSLGKSKQTSKIICSNFSCKIKQANLAWPKLPSPFIARVLANDNPTNKFINN